jgi:acyl-CoA synthetase (AMP-forming)/AMP-acid ligase II
VLEAAAFGLPDPVWGERVAAAVVLRPGATATADELAAFCRSHLAGYKTPRAFRFLDRLPRTGSGKVAKRLLREAAR